MTDEIDVLQLAIEEHRKAVQLKNMNQELMEHLTGSIFYLLKYAEKNKLFIPNRENLLQMLKKANSLIDEITYQPTGNTDKINREGNSTISWVLSNLWDMFSLSSVGTWSIISE